MVSIKIDQINNTHQSLKMRKLYVIFLLAQISLFAYEDYDIDGVDDSIDQCLNTPFDLLVDESGCPIGGGNSGGEILLKIGSDFNFDDSDNGSSSLSFFGSYSKNSFDISLSNYNYYDTFENSVSGMGDLYLSGGYNYYYKNLNTYISLGVKFATGDDEVGSGESDYLSSVNFDYYFDNKWDIFLYYGFSINGDSDYVDYQNSSSSSIGFGYEIVDKWYSSLSYDYSQSIYSDGDSYSAISLFNSYEFSDRYFVTINYSYALDDLSYDNSLSLRFGVRFD